MRRQDDLLKNLKSICLFAGPPRSGTTLIGSWIDAHAEASIAHEMNLLKYVSENRGREDLFSMLLKHNGAFNASGRRWSGYDYRINEWHGRYRALKVIGDKKAGATAHFLGARPELLTELKKTFRLPIKIVCVLRDPLEVIASVYNMFSHKGPAFAVSLEQAAEYYFVFLRGVIQCEMRLMEDELIFVELEEAVAAPDTAVKRICAFLGLDAEAPFTEQCRRSVIGLRRTVSDEFHWPAALLKSIRAKAKVFPRLSRYPLEPGLNAEKHGADATIR